MSSFTRSFPPLLHRWCTRSGSAMIALTVMRGLSDAYGSWKTICTERRMLRISPPSRPTMSVPRKGTEPEVASMSRRIRRPVVDLPQPDSPTRPRVSPRRTSKVRPHTACTSSTTRRNRPARTGKCLTRSRTSRIFSPEAGPLAPVGGASAVSVTASPRPGDVVGAGARHLLGEMTGRDGRARRWSAAPARGRRRAPATARSRSAGGNAHPVGTWMSDGGWPRMR